MIYNNKWNTTKQFSSSNIGGSYISSATHSTPSQQITSTIYPSHMLSQTRLHTLINFVTPTPANNSIINLNYINVTINASEPLTSVLLNWNGVNESMQGSGVNWHLNQTNLSDGVYTFKGVRKRYIRKLECKRDKSGHSLPSFSTSSTSSTPATSKPQHPHPSPINHQTP